MLTSFAPSPIANVILFKLSLISLTTYAFCFGVTLQHTTLSQSYATLMNIGILWGFFKINANESPSTSIDFFLPSLTHSSYVSLLSASFFSTSSRFYSANRITVMSPCINLQLLAMFSAVSNLSPVSIQTLMFALRKSAMVSGTNGYSLSSTAVAPIRYKSRSSSSVNLSYF